MVRLLRTSFALALLLGASPLAMAASPSGLPSASVPLVGTESIPMDQGAATVAAPSSRVGQPVQVSNCSSAVSSPFTYQWCIDTSTTPVSLKQRIGSAWAILGYFDATNGLWDGNIGGGSPTNLASAGTTDLGTVPSSIINITGNSAITSFGSSAPTGTSKILVFTTGGNILTNSGGLTVPGGANFTTAAGDVVVATSLGGSNWRISAYQQNIAPGSAATPTGAAGGSLTGTYPNPTIAAGVITNAMHVAASILGGSIAGGTITNTNIAAGTITGASIASGTITATNIQNSTITGTQIANTTITNSNVAAGAFGNITGVGTLTSGTWNASRIGLLYGGTNVDLSSTGGTSQVLQQAGAGANITVGQLQCSSLSNATTYCSATQGQLPGIATNTAAGTGNIAELKSATAALDSVGLSTGVAASIVQIDITAGEWDVTGNLCFLAAGATSVSRYVTSISTVNNTLDTTVGRFIDTTLAAEVPGASGRFCQNVGPLRVSLSGTTTYFLVADSVFTVSNMVVGGAFRATRIH